MRRDIEFQSKGVTCRGWLYTPDAAAPDTRHPTIVMAHGFSGVKEQALPDFAEQFATAGYAVLLFDYRTFGASDGEPRCQMFPLDMVEDYRNAINWACEQPNLDAGRIGIWGTSYSGGLVAYAATYDKRIKAVVAQVPSLTNQEARRAADPSRWDAVGRFLLNDRIERYQTGKVNYIKVVSSEADPCALPGLESFNAFMALKERAPNWRNGITVESLEKIREFDPVTHIAMIAPAALLVIAAERDSLIPIAAVRKNFERAPEPKKLVVHDIGHFDIYQEPWLSAAAGEAVAWYGLHLKS